MNQINDTYYEYGILDENHPYLLRESTLLPNKYRKTKYALKVKRVYYREGVEKVTFIRYSNDLDKLRKDMRSFVSWYDYIEGEYKEMQQNIIKIK